MVEMEIQASNPDSSSMLQKRKSKPLEDKYRERGIGKRKLSPTRHDPFKGDVTPNVGSRSYKEIIRSQRLEKERQEISIKQKKMRENIKEQRREQRRKRKEKMLESKDAVTTDASSKSEWDKTTTGSV